MRRRIKIGTIVALALSGLGVYSAFAALQVAEPQNTARNAQAAQAGSADRPASDSIEMRFPVAKTVPESYDEIDQKAPVDLENPSNLKTEVEYDPETNCYVIHTRVAGVDVTTPFMLSADEYNEYTLRKSMQQYYRERNAQNFAENSKSEFNFLDMNFSLGPLEKVFGPGGVQLTTQGSIELNMGLKYNKLDNPALPMSSRKKTYFDFDEKIQASVTAKVGDKMSFNMNYNTDATFDFDSKNLKLQYEGKEDEIIKNIEAGNVSMTTGSSLIRGSTALFGIKTTMQFGKLTATALISQQQSESKTVNASGGAQTTPFEIQADAYDENRHFFLAHFFRDNYDKFASKLPYVSSGVSINRIEVWITNKQGSYEESRNIVGFMDLAENSRIGNSHWISTTAQQNPMNNSNSLYSEIKNGYPDARNINLVTQALEPLSAYGIEGGQDYVKIESARKLSSSEYTLNAQLGYISLKSKLNADEMLAVAYEYTYNGQVYQVGEFSGDVTDTDQCLYLKMLKSSTVSTSLPIWDLMMKNVYSLGAYQVQKDKFRLYIKYMSDSTGVAVNNIPEGNIANKTLLQVMNLDRLDANETEYSDGIFDYIEGYTVQSSNGRIIFPVIEPFGSHLAEQIGNAAIAEKYVYQELYDSTLTVAQQVSEKNKFIMTGEYKASSGAEISLNAMNVPRGSVVVTAGGMTLVENSDYIVDYAMGVVTILNQSIIESGTPISVSLENQSMFNMQRKTMLGLDLNYAFSKDFNIGATIMHLSEKPLTEKVSMGDEVLNNTLWGVNLSYNTSFQWLTNWMNKIPTVNATAPSTLALTAEFAQLIPHQSKTGSSQGSSYIDDFESTQTGLDLKSPYSWTLASTPYDAASDALFPEARYSNDVRYGQNRALLSWYYIDRMFTQKTSSLIPAHLKNDLDQLSNPYVREVSVREIFPNKEINYGESTTQQTLNLSYYPQERGPYNLDADNIDEQGRLLNPEKRWGGIMRKMDYTDFESSNIEYIQFWLMDPFLDENQTNHKGGELYFNLGEVSEDILKDGMKSFENGLPIDGDTTQIATTAWGKVSKRQSLTYAFDNTSGTRTLQDVGLDGLTNDEEYGFSSYKDYLAKLEAKLSPAVVEEMRQDQFSPFNDPAGDNYHFYRGHDYDDAQTSILDRYKHYNGTEGNSLSTEDVADSYYQSSKSVPDVEDINQDNTLNEYERYYQYRISLCPDSLVVGKNYITDKRETTVPLRNGQEGKAVWYQFKVPLSQPQKKVGSIQDFKTIRFIRMFMTGFEVETHLRFATLELVRGEWRTYDYAVDKATNSPAQGNLDVSVVNIEENAGQEPVNYVLPPGVTRIIDPGQSQITQLNEQAMSLKVTDLPTGEGRAVYKNSGMDMRTYKRLQMFVHAEKLIDDNTNLRDGDVSVFLRLGSDNKSNYYEYEIPLSLTEPGTYSTYNTQDQEAVWPSSNMFDFPLSVFTDLKLERNAKKRQESSGVTFQTRYSIYDPDKAQNKVTIVGNPSLSDVRTMMIGVRNNSNATKSITIWVNEMRLTDFDQSGGWAAKANMNLGLSDIATLNIAGHVETAGFGGIDQSLTERRLDDYYQYNIATMVELGRFLPDKVKLRAPLFYSLTEQRTSPKYNPLDQDILLKDALRNAGSQHERDSINDASIERSTVESLSLSGVMFDIRSKNPMPYDPGNFSISYSYNRQSNQDPTTEFENTYDYRGSFTYSYTPFVKPWVPFKGLKSKSKHLKFLKEWELYYLPSNIAFNTNMSRYYYEQQIRDVSGSGGMALPISVSKNFLWDRQFSLSWNLTKSLNFSLQTMTNAHIEEPVGAVNKELFPDEYRAWKDTVMTSIKNLGTPWNYNQTFNASYTAPFSKIPVIDYMSFTAKYNATYTWDRGAQVSSDIDLGNTISNQGQLSLDGRFNFEQLYNKSKYLQKINRRFSSSNRGQSVKRKERKFERTILLREDTTVTLRHNLNNKKVKVVARDDAGKRVALRTKVIDANSVMILDKGTQRLNVVITPGKEKPNFWKEAAEYSLRGLMMVRNASVRYRKTNTTSLPLFSPNIGDIFGQSNSYGPMSPGLDFAFGFTDENYVYRAKERGWLLCDSTQISPAVIGRTEEFNIEIALEPIRGLKINLTGNRTDTRSSQMQFMYADMPTTRGGSYTKTHIALKTAFRSSSSKDGYASQAFNDFLRNREIIASRLEARYAQGNYPNRGFIASTGLAGQPYDVANGGVNRSSADVMIPAFLAAYSGMDANKVGLSPFPDITAILPNWRITYDGLMQVPLIKKYFKAFTLSHTYQCTYSVGSYSSYLNWVESDGDFGFIRDELSGNPIPSSPFDISSVMITERFAPLIGLSVTLKNNITGNIKFNDSRTLTLNSAAGQIVEATTTDFTIGAGYKIANFNTILKLRGSQTGVSNDLTINADFSFRKNQSLIRRIEQNFTQATSGTRTTMIELTANYVLSKRITVGAYFDHQINTPLVSSSSYPITNSNYGISVRLSLVK
ncbi:cell surface protein SprA [Barnesiella sp. An22]|uniref:T9SS outer membrane translocon Sov/SprA n=1 Tax=Barnesiella sp. An22 TaxID=1965590 RepID=UPI000B39A944|nr:cell surface protein SprA [Barnesiella sp. An22]OUO98592.1 cell surface protein SprA [Barnesiella sp. An22]